MTTVRIPNAADDAFPWVKASVAVLVCGALGLGLAKYGMEEDRTGESLEPASAEVPRVQATREEPALALAPAPEPEPEPTAAIAIESPDAAAMADAFVVTDVFIAPRRG